MAKPIDKTMIIRIVKEGNPFRTGTAVYKRGAAVLKEGRTVEQAIKAGARTSTVRWMLTAKRIELVPAVITKRTAPAAKKRSAR